MLNSRTSQPKNSNKKHLTNGEKRTIIFTCGELWNTYNLLLQAYQH